MRVIMFIINIIITAGSFGALLFYIKEAFIGNPDSKTAIIALIIFIYSGCNTVALLDNDCE